MSIWKFLGFGTNHERIAKYNQKAIEQQNVDIRTCCNTIMIDGIKYALKHENKDLVLAVLKKWPEAPDFYHHGISSQSNKNWKEAQKWLHELEHNISLKKNTSDKDLEEMKQKLEELEAKLSDFENK